MHNFAGLALIASILAAGAWCWVCKELRPFLDRPAGPIGRKVVSALFAASLFTALATFLGCFLLADAAFN